MNASPAFLNLLEPRYLVVVALVIVAVEVIVRLLLALRRPRRQGWHTGLWNSVAGAGLLLALGEAINQQRTSHLIAWLAMAGLAHLLSLVTPRPAKNHLACTQHPTRQP